MQFYTERILINHLWCFSGLFWNAFMISEENLMFVASWDTAQMNDLEMEDCCDDLSNILRELDREENWDKTIGEVFFSGPN